MKFTIDTLNKSTHKKHDVIAIDKDTGLNNKVALINEYEIYDKNGNKSHDFYISEIWNGDEGRSITKKFKTLNDCFNYIQNIIENPRDTAGEFLNVLKYNFKDIVSVCSTESGGGTDLIIKIYAKDFNSDLYKKIKYFIRNHSDEFISYHFNICFKISDEFAIVTIEDIKYCI